MKVRSVWAAAAAIGVALAGCDEAVDEEALIGPDRSHAAALEIGEAQWDEVVDIADAEGVTRWTDLPGSGSAEYRGVITGWADGGVAIDYVADLALDVEFDGNDVSGSVSNLVTDGVAGFAHPHGEIDLDGVIARDRDGTAMIVFDGSGPLYGPGMEATYTVDAAGSFAGRDAQGLLGAHTTDFMWTRGYLVDTTSRSDGLFSAVAAE